MKNTAASRTQHNLEHINKTYDLNVKIGSVCSYDGHPGVVVGTHNSHLRIRLDGEDVVENYHPTWKLTFDEAATNPVSGPHEDTPPLIWVHLVDLATFITTSQEIELLCPRCRAKCRLQGFPVGGILHTIFCPHCVQEFHTTTEGNGEENAIEKTQQAQD